MNSDTDRLRRESAWPLAGAHVAWSGINHDIDHLVLFCVADGANDDDRDPAAQRHHFQALTTTQAAALTATELNALSSTQIGELASTQVAALSRAAIAGLTLSQFDIFASK